MGTIPAYPTFVPLEIPTAAKLNQVKTAGDFWGLTPRCLAYATLAQTLGTSATFFAVNLDAEVYDIVQSGDAPSHDNVTQNTRLVARTAGKYEISGAVEFAASATGARTVCINMNAAGNQAAGTMLITQTQNNAGAGNATSVPVPAIEVPLSAGDYIEMFARQQSGGTLNTGPGRAQTWMRLKLTGS